MKILLTLCAAALLLPSLAPAQHDYQKFVAAFAKAREYNDEKSIDEAVRKDPDAALMHFKAYAWDYQAKGDAPTYEVVELLMQSWQRVFETRTLEEYERYIITRGASAKKALYENENAEREVYTLYSQGRENTDRGTLEIAYQGAVNMARSYQALGHALHAAKMFSLAAEITRLYPARTTDERREALEHMRTFMSLREQWDWTKDALYTGLANLVKSEETGLELAQEQAEKRRAEGYTGDVRGVDALVLPKAEELMAPLEFRVLKKPHVDTFSRGGTIPGHWLSQVIVGTGPAKLAWFGRREVYLLRPGANKFGVTTDPAIKDVARHKQDEISPNAKFRPTVFTIDEATGQEYAMYFYVAGEQEVLMGLTFNLQPTKDEARLYYRSASSWVAEIDGHELTYYDDNANGWLFEEDPYAIGMKDFSRDTESGVTMPTFDSMQVDNGPVHPLSDFVQVGDQWYHARGHEQGARVGLRPVNPEYFKTGAVELKWKGAKQARPEVLVLTGSGDFANTHFNVADGKPVAVPAGQYKISFGRISSGKGSRTIQAHVYHGKMELVEVVEGETTTLTLGGPFTLDFERGGQGRQLVVDARTIAVHGVAGERYARINGATPIPDVMAGRNEKGKGAKPVGSFEMMDLDYMGKAANKFSNASFEVAFFPMPKDDPDATLKLTVQLPFDDAYVGLQERKNKLFGTLKPTWEAVDVLDIKVVRDNPEAARQAAIKKRFPDRAAAVDRALEADSALRALIPEIDGMRSAQKAAAKQLGKLSAEQRQAHLEQQKQAKVGLQQLEEKERELRAALRDALMLIPAIPDPAVPDGDDDTGNVELRRVGEIPSFDFELRPHHELAEAQGWLDTRRAGHLAGSRNYYLFGELALLQDAVLRFATEHLVAKGYTAIDPPLLVRDVAMLGTAFFPGGEDQTYRCDQDELYLIGTSEVPVTALHGDAILDEAELPKRYVSRSTCFRREAGTYGRDTKGLYRVHQFHKVEQVVVDIASEERSVERHQEILGNAEEILQALGLPYRVVNVCGGDLGVGQVQKFDIESWMPSRESFGETHSASRFYDYQARRLNLRYRRQDNRKPAFCHTLNNTALASPRILIPLLEIHQLPDGRVRLPEVLRAYLGGRELLGKPL